MYLKEEGSLWLMIATSFGLNMATAEHPKVIKFNSLSIIWSLAHREHSPLYKSKQEAEHESDQRNCNCFMTCIQVKLKQQYQ